MCALGDQIQLAAEIIIRLKPVIALTGAGISVESGIPDFRGKNGLWSRYDPARYATIDAFLADPSEVWNMLREMDSLVIKAGPWHPGAKRITAIYNHAKR